MGSLEILTANLITKGNKFDVKNPKISATNNTVKTCGISFLILLFIYCIYKKRARKI